MHEEDIYWEYMKLINEIFVIYPCLVKNETIFHDIGCLQMIAFAHKTKKQVPSMPSSEIFFNILRCDCSRVARVY